MTSQDIIARATGWRHELHQRPELAFTEERTAEYLASVLGAMEGMQVTTGIGGTGLVASLTLGSSPRAIALRSDIDCLPLQEDSGLDYASRHEGRMHACGHDGHMAMVLGAAAELVENGGFDGTVRFLFQPAEEPGRGARAMIEDGVFDRLPVDAIYGLHNIPGLPAGHLHVRPGPIMASEDNFVITIRGRGGHASAPGLLVDPIVVSAEVVLALQTIVGRNVPPAESAVVSCTEVLTEGARNAVPSVVTIKGDTRSYTDRVRGILEQRITQISQGICAAHGATCEVSYTYEFDPTVNDAGCTARVVAAATEALGEQRVSGETAPIMASEDFGLFAREVPGCFGFIGNGVTGELGGVPLHSRDYRFNDEIIGAGIDFYTTLVRAELAAG